MTGVGPARRGERRTPSRCRCRRYDLMRMRGLDIAYRAWSRARARRRTTPSRASIGLHERPYLAINAHAETSAQSAAIASPPRAAAKTPHRRNRSVCR